MSQYCSFESHFYIKSWASPSGPEGRSMKQEKEFDYVQSAVYNALGVGKENAVSREELARRTGYSDRINRRAIEELRHDHVILSIESGYYIPHTNEQGRQETAVWLAMQRSRMKSIKDATRGAEVFVSEVPGQLEMAGAVG